MATHTVAGMSAAQPEANAQSAAYGCAKSTAANAAPAPNDIRAPTAPKGGSEPPSPPEPRTPLELCRARRPERGDSKWRVSTYRSMRRPSSRSGWHQKALKSPARARTLAV
ncbi:hypothetical protein PT2222_420035 [Paraburkholderia tropica]